MTTADPTWRRIAVALVIALNVYLVISAAIQFRLGGATDWSIFQSAAQRIASGANPYVELDASTHLAFRWSPVAALFLVGITQLPFGVWAGLHVVTLTPIMQRSMLLGLVVAGSWPFVVDVFDGGLMIFIAVVGWMALAGDRLAAFASLALALLIPRPVVIPLVVWILWHVPYAGRTFVILAVAHALGVMATGWGPEWFERLAVSGADVSNVFNIGPSRLLGLWWLVVGVPLAAVLLVRRRVGWACLAASPYILPPYLLILLLEVVPQPAGDTNDSNGTI